jgi:hypothetical protein
MALNDFGIHQLIHQLMQHPASHSRPDGPIPRSSGAASASSVDGRGAQGVQQRVLGAPSPRYFSLGLPPKKMMYPQIYSNGLEV